MMRAFNDRTMSVPLPSKLKGACPASAEHKNASVLSGATPLFSDVIDLPKDIADGLCCEMTQGNYYTNTLLGPSKKYPGQGQYICTAWTPSDPKVPPQFKPGNSSVTAGHSLRPPPPDPKCTQKQTIHECFGDSTIASCSWSGGQCTYGPPIECGNPGKGQAFCMGVLLGDKTYPSGGPAGRVWNSFNWTTGTLAGPISPVQMPPQILNLAQNGWFSVKSANATEGWKVCVQYNELREDGKSSDPNTGFVGCASYGGGMLDLTRGHTPNMDVFVGFGSSNGWGEKGFDPHATPALWGQYVFWSNSTSAVRR